MAKYVRCPKCKGTNLQFEIEQTQTKGKMKTSAMGKLHNLNRTALGAATLGISNIFIPKAEKTIAKTNIKNHRVCFCKDCGYMWNA